MELEGKRNKQKEFLKMREITVCLFADETDPIQREKLMIPGREENVVARSISVPDFHWRHVDAGTVWQAGY